MRMAKKILILPMKTDYAKWESIILKKSLTAETLVQ